MTFRYFIDGIEYKEIPQEKKREFADRLAKAAGYVRVSEWGKDDDSSQQGKSSN